MSDCIMCMKNPLHPDKKCCFNCSRASDNCDVCHICGEDCPGWDNAVKTNADRIRAMSDEELAQMLNKAIVCHHLRELGYCHKCPLFGAKPCDIEGIVDWLKQPAEGE